MNLRKKKKDIHVAFIQPIVASIMMAVSIPLVTLAASGTSSSQSSFVPHSLFDAVQFRKAHRMRHDLNGSSSSSASSVSSSVSSSAAMLKYDDLSGSQKADLQKQLRIGACPYDVTPEYRVLCETMLKIRRQQGSSSSSVPTGLRNPRQQ